MVEKLQNNPLCHITLNSSGGIALGAFMAGVFFEIIKESLEENHFVVDIITGTSAGAMTGAIASHLLLNNDKKAFETPKDNPLYQAWVDKADMKNIDSVGIMPIEELEVLRGINKIEKNPLSILSGEAIQKIAEVVQEPPSISRPLALLMTVTNVQGFLIQDEYSGNKSISSAEVRQFFFYPGREEDEDFDSLWSKVITSGRASGAFPVAFPPIPDSSSPDSLNFRNLSELYFVNRDRNPSFQNLPLVKDGKLNFLYTDGGILDNLPILKGIKIEANLAGNPIEFQDDNCYCKFKQALYKKYPELDPDKELSQADTFRRLHVFIQPNPASHLQSPKRLLKPTFTLLEMLSGSLSLPHDEHDAIQLRQILEIKQQVKLKQEILQNFEATDPNNQDLRKKLQELVPYESINLSPITPLILRQIKNPTIQNGDRTQVDSGKLKQRLERLNPICKTLMEYEDFKKFLDEFVPDSTSLLASDFISAFGGFFDRRYREHDFLLGRICGLTWIYLNFDIEETDASKKHLDEILQEISRSQKKILPSSPKVKLSYRTRLFRIFLRFLRIVTLESQPQTIKNGEWSRWNLLYFPLAIPVVILLRFAETITTFVLWILSAVRL